MNSNDSKIGINYPTDLDFLISEQLARLTFCAYEASKGVEIKKISLSESESSDEKEKNYYVPGLMNFNRAQAEKYRIYEFRFDPNAAFEEPLEGIFNKAFTDNARAIFYELQELFPDGVKLLHTRDNSSPLPRYEYHGRIILTSIRLAGEKLIQDRIDEAKNESLRKVISKRLHKKWQKYVDLLESSYRTPPNPQKQFQALKKIIYDFQNAVRAELVEIVITPETMLNEEHQLHISKMLLEYEQTISLDLGYDVVDLERELNCDLFRLHENTDGNFQFQYYFRHHPVNFQRYKNQKCTVETPQGEILKTNARLLYPTGSAHGDGTLPNFAKVVEGTVNSNFSQINVGFSGFRRGTPIDIRNPMHKMSDIDKEQYKHDILYQVYLNYCLELMIIRAQKIQTVFLLNNRTRSAPPIPIVEIQKLSYQLSIYISAELDEKLLHGYIDPGLDPMGIFEKALSKTNISRKYPKMVMPLYGCVSEFFLAQSFYTHIISGHDNMHLIGDHAGIMQWFGFRLNNQIRKKQDVEATQFRACRVTQYALDYTEKDFGIGYMCLPLNYPDDSYKIVNYIKLGLVQIFLKMQIAFPDDTMIQSIIQSLGLNFFKNFFRLRAKVTGIAKKYLNACRPDLKTPIQELRDIRKKEFKPAEDLFLNSLDSFSLLSDAIRQTPSSSIPGMLLKVIFDIFNNGKGEWAKSLNGVIPALFQFLTSSINQSLRVAVATTGGCKSANDRWQKVALILTDIVKEGVDENLKNKLNKIMRKFGDDIALNLSRIQTTLEGGVIPKTPDDKLAFKKLKASSKIHLPDGYISILKITQKICLVLTETLPTQEMIDDLIPSKYRAGYLRYQNQIFYADKSDHSLHEIKYNPLLFDISTGVSTDQSSGKLIFSQENRRTSIRKKLSNKQLDQLSQIPTPNFQRVDFRTEETPISGPDHTPAEIMNHLIFQKNGSKILNPLSGGKLEWANGAIGIHEIVGSRYLYPIITMDGGHKPSLGMQDAVYLSFLDHFPNTESDIHEFFMKENSSIHLHLKEKVPDILKEAGATLITVVIDEKTFSVSNMGDCTFYLITEIIKSDPEEKAEYKIELLNDLDKPDHPDEARRLVEEKVNFTPASRFDCARLEGRLAVSAGFGDELIKGVRRFPKIKAAIPYPSNSYGILACDGLTEQWSANEIKTFFISRINEFKASTPLSLARDLTHEAFKKGSTDNITTIVIDFNLLKKKNKGKIVELAISDGHGFNGHILSQEICNALELRPKKFFVVKNQGELQEPSFDYKQQCLPFDTLAAHKRLKKFKQEEHGWLSFPAFSALCNKKFNDYKIWREWIMPKVNRFETDISNLFYDYCRNKWLLSQVEDFKENKYEPKKQSSDNNLKKIQIALCRALNELEPPTEHERLAIDWLIKYFQRQQLLLRIDSIENSYISEGLEEFDEEEEEDDEESNASQMDTSEEEEEEERKRQSNESKHSASSPHRSQGILRPKHKSFQKEKELDGEKVYSFLRLCEEIFKLRMISQGNGLEELNSILNHPADLSLKAHCQVIFKLIDKAYHLQIKAAPATSFLTFNKKDSKFSEICKCFMRISPKDPKSFNSSLSEEILYFEGIMVQSKTYSESLSATSSLSF